MTRQALGKNFRLYPFLAVEQADDWRKQSSTESIDSLFPEEVIDVITDITEDSGTLNLNIVGRNDLSSSWVLEKPSKVNQRDITNFEGSFSISNGVHQVEANDFWRQLRKVTFATRWCEFQ